MESRIETLLEKYWAGETSLGEEEELKVYFKNNPSLAPTGLYFSALSKERKVESKRSFKRPERRFFRKSWSVAASLVVGVTIAALALQDVNSRNDFEVNDPEEAYEIARTVLMKMSTSLNEGKTHSTQLKKINKAEEIIKEEKL